MNLVQLIADTIKIGLEVILTIDANENVIKDKLYLQPHKLGLVEAYNKNFKTAGLASYFRGSE